MYEILEPKFYRLGRADLGRPESRLLSWNRFSSSVATPNYE